MDQDVGVWIAIGVPIELGVVTAVLLALGGNRRGPPSAP